MYRFVDVMNPAQASDGLSLTFNGVKLEQALTNDRGRCLVLTVNGRSVVKQKHQTVDVAGRNGQFFRQKTLDVRKIEVSILLSGNSNQAFRLQYEKLNQLLDTSQPAPLSFSDEPDRSYVAQFEECDAPDEVSNEAVLKLSFICYDPLKYSATRSVTGSVVQYAGTGITYPVITIKLSAGASEIRLLHLEQQKYIRLKATYLAGGTLVIDMKRRTITLNGRNELMNFDMVNSRFFGFRPGKNTLQLSVAGTIKSDFQEVYV